jgi:hypothetical protein
MRERIGVDSVGRAVVGLICLAVLALYAAYRR